MNNLTLWFLNRNLTRIQRKELAARYNRIKKAKSWTNDFSRPCPARTVSNFQLGLYEVEKYKNPMNT